MKLDNKKSIMSNSNYFNEGKNNSVAFVFSAPGQKEEKNNKPISGQTGKNLETILKILKKSNIEEFSSYKNRYDFRITNSFTDVLFLSKNNRTEATIKEIKEPKNIERLRSELIDITKYIFFFGLKPQSIAYLLSDLKARFIFAPHLGFQSINQIDRDVENILLIPKDNQNTEKRLKVVANYILKQIKS